LVLGLGFQVILQGPYADPSVSSLSFDQSKFYFTSPQPIKSKEASDSDFTIENVMLWPGMRFSLRYQCKRCSAGRLHKQLDSPNGKITPAVLLPLMPNRHFLVKFWKCRKAVSILSHEAKALLEVFCL